MPATQPQGHLTRDALGVPGIVFLVLAAVAPLTAMVVVAPIALAVGNGGIPGAFLLAVVALLLFAVGYAQMSRHVVNAGAFYAYVTKAIGPRAGVATAYLAVLGYNCFMVGATATSGFFTNLVLNDLFSIDVPWQVWSLVSLVGILVLGRRGVDVSARLLGVALVCESAILVAMDISILVQTGWDLHAFDPSLVLGSGIGLSLLFAFTCFVGFEATALFAEEARDPFRTIPRATYTALILMGVFQIVTTLSMVSAYGATKAQAVATDPKGPGPGGYVFAISDRYLGSFLTDVMQLLLLVSLFAAFLALHNAATRYLFALGRARLLPRYLGRTAADGAPAAASATQVAFNTVVVGAFVIGGADPLIGISAAMTGFGTLGIVALQGAAAISVVVFFRRRRDPRWLSTAIAPGLGAAGLVTVFILAVANFPTLAGSSSPVIGKLPWLVLVVVVGGFAYATWLRSARPGIYAQLGEGDPEFASDPEPAAAQAAPAVA